MSIADNIKRVQDAIADACARADRDPDEITLVAVSKQKSLMQILEAERGGLRHFGENRVDEGIGKIAPVNRAASKTLTWHMVGHVQTRKAKLVAPRFDVIQSVDSRRLAGRLSGLAGGLQIGVDALLQVNVSGEASKYGFAGYNWYGERQVRDRLWDDMRAVAALPGLNLMGLMTMAPWQAPEAVLRKTFADLYRLREELTESLGMALPQLSMGMTDDYLIAIEEGATMLRIGRAIFGERHA